MFPNPFPCMTWISWEFVDFFNTVHPLLFRWWEGKDKHLSKEDNPRLTIQSFQSCFQINRTSSWKTGFRNPLNLFSIVLRKKRIKVLEKYFLPFFLFIFTTFLYLLSSNFSLIHTYRCSRNPHPHQNPFGIITVAPLSYT